MNIYLASTNGLFRWLFSGIAQKENDMKIYLAGDGNRRKILADDIRHLAGLSSEYNRDINLAGRLNMLESFYYVKDWQVNLFPHLKSFMLDSGAFTFMSGKHISKKELKNYTDRYCEFIKDYDIELFFEMDVDVIYGYEEVKKIRKYIERKTKKQPIPVWHKSRGKNDFVAMCKEYPYVAIGGIVTKEITRADWVYFPWFIDKAHELNCKIHGLGFTPTSNITKYCFDSVDSSAWLYGNRGGFLYMFHDGVMHKIDSGAKRLKSCEVAKHNFEQWIKYSEWAELNIK